MEKQLHILTTQYERSDFTLDEGERYLKELEEIRQVLERYHGVLASLIDRSRVISPIWQRGERVDRPTPVTALCNFQDRNVGPSRSLSLVPCYIIRIRYTVSTFRPPFVNTMNAFCTTIPIWSDGTSAQLLAKML